MDEKIYNLINSLNDIYIVQEKNLDKQIEYIITNKVTDINIIENCLDLITSIPTKKAQDLAFKLCDYYDSINKKNAKVYKKIIYKTYEEDL